MFLRPDFVTNVAKNIFQVYIEDILIIFLINVNMSTIVLEYTWSTYIKTDIKFLSYTSMSHGPYNKDYWFVRGDQIFGVDNFIGTKRGPILHTASRKVVGYRVFNHLKM